MVNLTVTKNHTKYLNNIFYIFLCSLLFLQNLVTLQLPTNSFAAVRRLWRGFIIFIIVHNAPQTILLTTNIRQPLTHTQDHTKHRPIYTGTWYRTNLTWPTRRTSASREQRSRVAGGLRSLWKKIKGIRYEKIIKPFLTIRLLCFSLNGESLEMAEGNKYTVSRYSSNCVVNYIDCIS